LGGGLVKHFSKAIASGIRLPKAQWTMLGVGTKKVYEDELVSVWHMGLAPGEETGRHTHELDYLIKIVEGSTLEVRGPEDEHLDTVEIEAGKAVSFHIVGDEIHSDLPGYPTVPATHSAKNVGDTNFREVLIEFKK